MINITEIQGTDGLNASRITINNNFRSLKDAIDVISDKFVIDGSTITIGSNGYDVRSYGDMMVEGIVSTSAAGIKIGNTVLTEEQLIRLIELIPINSNSAEDTTTENSNDTHVTDSNTTD